MAREAVVLVESPHASRGGKGRRRARVALAVAGIDVRETVTIGELERLRPFLRRSPLVGGVHVYHARRLRVHVDEPLEVSLDGEIAARVPGDFVLAGEALRVVTGPRFVDVDDPTDPEVIAI